MHSIFGLGDEGILLHGAERFATRAKGSVSIFLNFYRRGLRHHDGNGNIDMVRVAAAAPNSPATRLLVLNDERGRQQHHLRTTAASLGNGRNGAPPLIPAAAESM